MLNASFEVLAFLLLHPTGFKTLSTALMNIKDDLTASLSEGIILQCLAKKQVFLPLYEVK